MRALTFGTATREALLGDDRVLALFDADRREVLRLARDKYRDGHTSDQEIAAIIGTIDDRDLDVSVH